MSVPFLAALVLQTSTPVVAQIPSSADGSPLTVDDLRRGARVLPGAVLDWLDHRSKP